MPAPPAYTTDGFTGSTARTSATPPVKLACQLSPPSVLLNRVQALSVAYTVLGVSGSTATALTPPDAVRFVDLQLAPPSTLFNTPALVVVSQLFTPA